VLPFVLLNFAILLIITYVPAISMVLLGHAQ
jgi:TRAP-type C4-dicarboxylate transport system permease large subunit